MSQLTTFVTHAGTPALRPPAPGLTLPRPLHTPISWIVPVMTTSRQETTDRPALPEVLETERLVLRPYEPTDVDDVLAYAQDPEWSRFLRMLPRPYLREHAVDFLARQAEFDRAVHPTWALVAEGAVNGGINLRFTFEHGFAELGYSVARSKWGRGYCSEAARAVIAAAFETHGDLNRIQARADRNNLASQRVMTKVGMTKEGVMRLSRIERGEAYDEAWYAILRSEWEAGR